MVLVLMLKMGAGVGYSEMMLDALQPLYPDCGGEHTKLSAVIELLSMKASKYKRYIGSLNRKSRSKAMNYSPWLREELLGTPMTEFHRIVLGPSFQTVSYRSNNPKYSVNFIFQRHCSPMHCVPSIFPYYVPIRTLNIDMT